MTYPIVTIGELGAPCACSSSPRSVNMGDASEAVAITSGGWLPTIVWPSDVDAYKRKLDPDFAATNATAERCANLPLATASGWGEFFIAWKKFRDEGSCIFGCANKFDEAKEFEFRLRDWQKKIQETCKLGAPEVVPSDSRPENQPDTSAIKFIAVAVGLVAIAYMASPLIAGARSTRRR